MAAALDVDHGMVLAGFCSVHALLSRVVTSLLSLVFSRPLVSGSHLFSAGWPEEDFYVEYSGG